MAYWKDRYDELFRDADCEEADFGGGRTRPLPGLGEPATARPRVHPQATCGHRKSRIIYKRKRRGTPADFVKKENDQNENSQN